MTTPSEPDNGEPREGVNLGKDDPTSDAPFDPYRFGKPDHPIPAEYAPPGYTGPVIPPPSPYGPPPPPYVSPQEGPYGGPPSPYQYPYLQPGQYGPTPPPYHGYAQPRAGSNGKAIAGLALGIASIVFCFFSVLDAIPVILGLVFSLIGISETKAPGTSGRGMAVAGLVCTIVGALLATLITVWYLSAVNNCGGLDQRDTPGFNTCVQDHL